MHVENIKFYKIIKITKKCIVYFRPLQYIPPTDHYIPKSAPKYIYITHMLYFYITVKPPFNL